MRRSNFITDYPVGIWRKLPMRWPRTIELTSPPVRIVMPLVFFQGAGAFPYVASGLGMAILVSSLLTRPLDT